jgi:hypothetical protein
MLTIPVPVRTDRLQIRFEGVVPALARDSAEARQLIAEGKMLPGDNSQQIRDGLPVWIVRISLRDRNTGAVSTEKVRVSAIAAPYGEIPMGSFVELEGLALAHSDFGRSYSFDSIRVVDRGDAAMGARPLQYVDLDPTGLTFWAEGIAPKLRSHSDDVRSAIAEGRVDAGEIAVQDTDTTSKLPLWQILARIDNDVDVLYENLTVPSHERPEFGIGEPFTVEGLRVMYWQLGRGQDRNTGTTLRADSVHRLIQERKGRKVETHEAPQGEPVSV